MIPKIILHVMLSVDGRMKGLSGDIGLYYSIATTFDEDATLVGSGTMLAAIPLEGDVDEKVMDQSLKQDNMEVEAQKSKPILIAVDSRGRVWNMHVWREQPYWSDLVVLCSSKTPREYLEYLSGHHIEYLTIGEEKVDLEYALEILGHQYRFKTIRADCGPTLSRVLLDLGLISEISVMLSPELVGVRNTTGDIENAGNNGLARIHELEAVELELLETKRLENDHVWLHYEVKK